MLRKTDVRGEARSGRESAGEAEVGLDHSTSGVGQATNTATAQSGGVKVALYQ